MYHEDRMRLKKLLIEVPFLKKSSKLTPEPNNENYILWQGVHCAAVLNLYPYVSGHVLVLPKRKVGDLASLNDKEYIELWEGVRLATQAIQSAYSPDGINIGVNIGEAAGGEHT